MEEGAYARQMPHRPTFVVHCCDDEHRTRLLSDGSAQLTRAAEHCTLRLASCNTPTPAPAPAAAPIDVAALQSLLTTRRYGRVVVRAEGDVRSTQDVLRGEPLRAPLCDGVVVVAAKQTAGRGRGGSSWSSPDGSLAFSVECRLPASLVAFAQYVAALAVAELHPSLRVKWPNDVLAGATDRRKVAGVLCEGTLRGSEAALVVGIGVNVSEAACGGAALRSIHPQTSAPASASAPDHTQTLARILNNLEPLVDMLRTHGFAPGLAARYYARWLHGGQQVALADEGGTLAQVVGLAPNGCVRVKRNDGSTRDCPPDVTSLDLSGAIGVLKNKCQPVTGA